MKCAVYSESDGNVHVFHPVDRSISDSALKALVKENTGKDCKILSTDNLPDRLFRNAWKEGSTKVSVDIPKAKELTHEARRFARDGEMAPFDLKVTIPDESAAAEAERVKLRKKYANLQTEIDASSTETALKSVMKKLP